MLTYINGHSSEASEAIRQWVINSISEKSSCLLKVAVSFAIQICIGLGIEWLGLIINKL